MVCIWSRSHQYLLILKSYADTSSLRRFLPPMLLVALDLDFFCGAVMLLAMLVV